MKYYDFCIRHQCVLQIWPGELASGLMALGLLAWVAPLSAQGLAPDLGTAPEKTLNPITVQSTRGDLQGVADSASEGLVTRKQLETRPLLRAGDVLETVPGLVATQHSGGGKANQYFLRGFNLDHGTDFAVTVDGMPVNMPSHGHGQGFADLNFLIPDLVDSGYYRKGPYHAEEGDFSARRQRPHHAAAQGRCTVWQDRTGPRRFSAGGGSRFTRCRQRRMAVRAGTWQERRALAGAGAAAAHQRAAEMEPGCSIATASTWA